jgi:hypothetical protein
LANSSVGKVLLLISFETISCSCTTTLCWCYHQQTSILKHKVYIIYKILLYLTSITPPYTTSNSPNSQ